MRSGILAVDLAYAFGMIVVVPMGVWLLGGRSGGAAGALLLGAIAARGLFADGDRLLGLLLIGAWG